MTTTNKINKLVVIGVGLIGGSFALALKRAGLVNTVTGVGRSPANLDTALRLGVVDEICVDPASAVVDADMVLLAVPVGQMAGVMAAIAPALPEYAVVSDAGSTKQDVVALARQFLPQHLPRFVPAHPIAGAEKSGAEAALVDLYYNKNLVITALSENTADAIKRVRDLWLACGARIREMTPAEHDGVFAAVSHLPHLLAFALVDEIAAKPNAEQCFRFAASGFRDSTRIASSSPEMWRDISLANRNALLEELQQYQQQLTRLQMLLANADGEGMLAMFTRARDARNHWLTEILGSGKAE
ncbi:MAG: prephenate dehydrogenase/arogenate dehydrogenase family protein [Neisseriaceae bacterium]|jgi:prephenate dehydrogenase|nr:Prephenate dehydrogenase/arogenate dehydrogenase family protein [Pseudomonadota bacterium]RTL02341.1 MAG: prephenate dehydrogenase/arogenate dehydrogenase family protein [Neisseriaceae bacterium]TXG95252.1 MAG: prephenate dehydrogenase/arogenate dehydrogenase family protein [Rhodocyclaceae bacterium]